MNLNKLLPQILIGYVDNKGCSLSTNECNELTKYVSGLELELTTAQEEVKEIQHGFEILSLSNGNLREENKRLHELVVDTYNILNHGRNTTQSENYEVFDRLENEALNGGKND